MQTTRHRVSRRGHRLTMVLAVVPAVIASVMGVAVVASPASASLPGGDPIVGTWVQSDDASTSVEFGLDGLGRTNAYIGCGLFGGVQYRIDSGSGGFYQGKYLVCEDRESNATFSVSGGTLTVSISFGGTIVYRR